MRGPWNRHCRRCGHVPLAPGRNGQAHLNRVTGGAVFPKTMAARAQLEVTDTGEGPLGVVIRGTVDIAAVAALRQELLDAMTPHRNVVVFVDQVEKLDGAGVQLLFAAKRFTERRERTFTLVVGDGSARRAIETAGAGNELEGEEKCRR